jgi:hypothetical protein
MAVGVAWGIVPNPAPLEASFAVRHTGTVRDAISMSTGGSGAGVGSSESGVAAVGVGLISGAIDGLGEDAGSGVVPDEVAVDSSSGVAVG